MRRKDIEARIGVLKDLIQVHQEELDGLQAQISLWNKYPSLEATFTKEAAGQQGVKTGTWQEVMAVLDNHFGGDLATTGKQIQAYAPHLEMSQINGALARQRKRAKQEGKENGNDNLPPDDKQVREVDGKPVREKRIQRPVAKPQKQQAEEAEEELEDWQKDMRSANQSEVAAIFSGQNKVRVLPTNCGNCGAGRGNFHRDEDGSFKCIPCGRNVPLVEE